MACRALARSFTLMDVEPVLIEVVHLAVLRAARTAEDLQRRLADEEIRAGHGAEVVEAVADRLVELLHRIPAERQHRRAAQQLRARGRLLAEHRRQRGAAVDGHVLVPAPLDGVFLIDHAVLRVAQQVLRRLEVLEALDRGEVAARQRQLDAGLAVVVPALRHVRAGERRRAADRGEEIEREAEVLHLLAGDQGDR